MSTRNSREIPASGARESSGGCELFWHAGSHQSAQSGLCQFDAGRYSSSPQERAPHAGIDCIDRPLRRFALRGRRSNKMIRRSIPFKGTRGRAFQESNDRRIVIGDRIHVVNSKMIRICRILLRFVARKESPATVNVVVRRFPVHVSNLHPVDSDSVGGDASAKPRGERLDLMRRYSKGLRHYLCDQSYDGCDRSCATRGGAARIRTVAIREFRKLLIDRRLPHGAATIPHLPVHLRNDHRLRWCSDALSSSLRSRSGFIANSENRSLCRSSARRIAMMWNT